MKRILLLLTLSLFMANNGDAQTLQFNQVLLIQQSSGAADTVPSGKVWKIENIGTNSTSKTSYYLNVNGSIWRLYNEASSSSSAYHDHIGPGGPIWFPAGTVFSGGSASYIYNYSIIEFSVVP